MLSYRIDRVDGFVELLGTQGAHPAAFRHLFEAIFADPDYHRGFGFYRDRRGVEPMTIETLRANMADLAAMPGLTASRWAFVVTDPTNYGMTRMAAILGDGSSLELAIFESPEPAKAWLAERTELAGP